MGLADNDAGAGGRGDMAAARAQARFRAPGCREVEELRGPKF